MRQIRKETLNLVVAENFNFPFGIDKDGLYALEITASAKGWWNNLINLRFISFYSDDNLIVKLDNIEFSKLNGKKGLFDGEASWNGNDLNGLNKTNLIVTHLGRGQHNLHFFAQKNPLLKNITVYKIKNQEINYIPEDNPAEDGNRRPWITIILVSLGLKNLKIQASAQKSPWPKDSDDLKLIIDGNIVKNPATLLHRNWFWCGGILEGAIKEFNQDLNLDKKLHYIELWADKMPRVETINLKINKIENNNDGGEIQSDTNKRIPTADNPLWTGNFNDDPEEIILARLIFGEARNQPDEAKKWVGWSVINRIEAKSWWPNTAHEVILQEGQYDPFKIKDSNFLKIIDPFGFKGSNDQTKKAWYKCYQIAKNIVARETINPTRATHFHGVGITQEWFEKNVIPQGKFIKKIGDTYFYWSPN